MYRKLKTIILSQLGLLVLFINPSFADDKKPMNVFLWEIHSKENASKVNYLVGTIHLPLGNKYKLPENLLNRLVKSKVFVMETKVDLSDETIKATLKYMFLEKKGELKSLVSEKDWGKLREIFEKIGYQDEVLNKIEPWFLSLQLIMPQKTEEDINNSLDQVLKNEAIKDKISIDYFESAEEQFKILDSMPIEGDIKALMELINYKEEFKKISEELEKIYLSNDQEKYEELFFNSKSRFITEPIYYENLVLKRNDNWIPKIENLLKNNDSFIAVGLGHLLGKKGLIEVLKNKGYKIERINLLN